MLSVHFRDDLEYCANCGVVLTSSNMANHECSEMLLGLCPHDRQLVIEFAKSRIEKAREERERVDRVMTME